MGWKVLEYCRHATREVLLPHGKYYFPNSHKECSRSQAGIQVTNALSEHIMLECAEHM